MGGRIMEENEIKIGIFKYEKQKKYVQLSGISGVEIEIEGKVYYFKEGMKIKPIRSEVSIKPVGIVDGARFKTYEITLQKHAEDALSEAFDDYLNYQITRKRREFLNQAQIDEQEERLNQWFRNKFWRDRKRF